MQENEVPAFVVIFATQEVLYFKNAKTGEVPKTGSSSRRSIVQNIFQPLRWAWIPMMLSKVAKRRD